MFGVIMLSILTGLHKNEIGLCDLGSVGVLFLFYYGFDFGFFQIFGILLCAIVWLKMSVKPPIATGPRCFKCRKDIPSEIVDTAVDLVLSIAALVTLGLKGGGCSERGTFLLCVLSISLSVGLWGVVIWMSSVRTVEQIPVEKTYQIYFSPNDFTYNNN